MITDKYKMMKPRNIIICITLLLVCLIARSGNAQDLRKIEEDFLKGEFSGSEVYCVDPRNPRDQARVYYLAGLNYLNMGSPCVARDFFRKSFTESKDTRMQESASVKIGDSFFQEENYPQAIVVYEYFLSKFPSSAKKDEVYYKAALACAKTGDWGKEREYIRQVKQNLSQSSLLYGKLAQLQDQGYFFIVQAGVFINKNNAAGLIAELKEKGYATTMVEENSDKQPVYKVICGRYPSRDRAQQAADLLGSRGYSAVIYP